MDNGELTHEGWKELRQGPDIGWDIAAMNSANVMYPEAETDVDNESRQAKIEHVGDFMRKVIALPLEPVVFYRPGHAQKIASDDFFLFNVITPAPEKPVDFMSPDKDEQRNAVLRLNPYSKDMGHTAMHTVSAGFEVNANVGEASGVKVWFGIGNQSINVSPDKAYDERDLGTEVAIGSKEASELLTSLRSEDSVRNGRLFGVLFDIAWMAHDLGIKPANLGGFGPQKVAAIEAVHVRRSAASSLARSSSKIFDLLQQASLEAASQTETIKSAQSMYEQSIGDVYVRDLYDNREVDEEVNTPYINRSQALPTSVNRQHTSAQRIQKAINSYDKQLAILNSIVND